MESVYEFVFQLATGTLGALFLLIAVVYVFSPSTAIDIGKRIGGATLAVSVVLLIIAHLLASGEPLGYALLAIVCTVAYFIHQARGGKPERPRRTDAGERTPVFPRHIDAGSSGTFDTGREDGDA